MGTKFEAKAIADQIVLSWKYDQPVFNSEDDLYLAIIDIVPAFAELDCIDKLYFSLHIFNNLTKSISLSRKFIYDLAEDLHGDLIVSIWDGDDYALVFEVYFATVADTFMRDERDIRGLKKYLVSMGELLPQDKLTYSNF